MHILINFNDIVKRAARVGLKHVDICKRAGIATSTFVRARQGKDTRTRTLRKMSIVLVEEETALRDYLNQITQHHCPVCGEPVGPIEWVDGDDLEAAE